MTSYDSIPYPSYAYASSSPDTLNAIARLLGMKPTNPKRARVLEIGCASGGNLLPLACRYPEAIFTGIDPSKVQINQAIEQLRALRLSNVTLMADSINNVDLTGQVFDYIIVHGVYSWVPVAVQQRILAVCGENLATNGVAYVSYNTKPGWNAIKTVREMMLYHGQHFAAPEQKVQEARKMLSFVTENIRAVQGPHKAMLEHEIKNLQQADDNYVLHEYLEAVNEPCYFYEFMEKAAQQGLAYLGDSDLPTMNLGNQTKAVSNLLAKMNDTIRAEQYVDFILNRRFRMTLLVKEDARLNRKLTLNAIDGLYLNAKFGVQQPFQMGQEGLQTNLTLTSPNNPEVVFDIAGKVRCAGYLELLRAAHIPLTLAQIVSAVNAIMPDISEADIRQDFGSLALKLVFNGAITITGNAPQYASEVPDMPEIFAVARLAALTGSKVANLRHEIVNLNDGLRAVVPYVNGKNSREEIIAAVRKRVDSGELTINVKGNKLAAGSEAMADVLPLYIDEVLSLFAKNALLKV